MTPDQQAQLARTRYAIITSARASGVVIMLLGLWIAFGDILREGGAFVPGMLIFLVGMAESLFLTQWLTRRWRTPPRP